MAAAVRSALRNCPIAFTFTSKVTPASFPASVKESTTHPKERSTVYVLLFEDVLAMLPFPCSM